MRSPVNCGRGRGAERGEDERGTGGRSEVLGNLIRFIGVVLIVLVERGRPGHLLRRRIDPHRGDHATDGAQDVPGDLPHRPVRPERDALRPPVAVLHHVVMPVQIEGHHECTGPVRRRERQRSPSPERSVEGRRAGVGFGRGQRNSQFAQELGVRVQGVAGRSPGVVGQRLPPERIHLPNVIPPARRRPRCNEGVVPSTTRTAPRATHTHPTIVRRVPRPPKIDGP